MSDNHKGILQELCQKRKESPPVYSKATTFTDNTGSYYYTEVNVNFKGERYKADGKARSKKDAERQAAGNVLRKIFFVHPHEKSITETGSGLDNKTQPSSYLVPTFNSSSSTSSSSSSGNSIIGSSNSGGGVNISSSSSNIGLNSFNNIGISSNESEYHSNFNNDLESNNISSNNSNISTISSNINSISSIGSINSNISSNSSSNNNNSSSSSSNSSSSLPPTTSILGFNNSFGGVNVNRRGQEQSEILKLQLQLEQSIRTFTERYTQLEKKYNDLREVVERKHVETRDYIARKLKRKSRKSERSPMLTLNGVDELGMVYIPEGNGTPPIDGNSGLSHQTPRSTITIMALDNDLVPSQITFFRYRVVFSHGFQAEDFNHLNQKYNFTGYLLYTTKLLPKPVVHISNGAGEHFAICIEEYDRETLQREEFAKLVTFHNLFYTQILRQKHMNYSTLEDFYFVPFVKCYADPTQRLCQTLINLLTYEDLTNEVPVLPEKEFRAYFDQKYINRVVLTPRMEFNICRGIDHSSNYEYNDPSCFSVKDRNGNPMELKSGVCPSVLCTHSTAVPNQDYWKLKSLIFFDANDQPEDPTKWQSDEFKNMEPTQWESYIRKSKLLPKDPLVLKVFGITSTMHAVAKVAILSYIPEIHWYQKMENFKKSFINIHNQRLLREVFTHPSTKRNNLVPPRNLKIFKDYLHFTGDNQRLEYLGDSILKFCVTYYLYFKFPDASEGFLTTKRSDATNNLYLQDVCNQAEIDDILRLSYSKEDYKKPKADVIEALFAAVYLERGMLGAYEFIIKMLFKVDDVVFPTYKCQHNVDDKLSESQKNALFGMNIKITNPCLFLEAMNCSSDPKCSYQRLEFLGDSYIDVVTSVYLYETFPKEQEGFLSQTRALLVRNEKLAQVSNQLKFKECIDPNVITTAKRMGDLFESFVGCLLLDAGLEESKRFITKFLPLRIDHINELLESYYSSIRPIPLQSVSPIPDSYQDITIPEQLLKVYDENEKKIINNNNNLDQNIESMDIE